MRSARWAIMVFFAAAPVILAAVLTSADAVALEPGPDYVDIRALRADATLNAVAFAAADTGDQSVGIAVGDRGTVLRSIDGGRSWEPVDSRVECSLRDVYWINRQQVAVVGGQYDRITRISRGVVLLSNDGGLTWRRGADQELPALWHVTGQDDRTLVAQGDWSHSLLANNLESHDGGRTWNAPPPSAATPGPPREPAVAELTKWSAAVGVPIAIRDACRVGPSSLCAVGDHGVIMLSVDGGKTWDIARGEGRRTGLLVIANQPDSVAWSLLGSEALEHRNRVALLVHQTAACDRPDQFCEIAIADHAAVNLGGAGADLVGQGDPVRIARQWLSIHRPAALVLDETLPRELQDAFIRAASETRVTSVATYTFSGRGKTTLHRNALLPRTGVLACDLFDDAMHWINPMGVSAPSTSISYVYDTALNSRRGESLLDGMTLWAGARLEAEAGQASRRRLQTVQARLKQSEKLSQWIHEQSTATQFAPSFRAMLDQTAREDQFRLTWATLVQVLARGSNRPSGTVTAMEIEDVVLAELATRFPDLSVARWAQLRRDAVQHSSEWRRLRSAIAKSPRSLHNNQPAESIAVSPFQVDPSGVRQAAAISPVVVPKPEQHELTSGRNENKAEVDLTWEFHPLVLIARDAARRRGDDGNLQVSSGQSADLKRLAQVDDSGWSPIVRHSGSGVVTAQRATRPPRLDGQLDDVCWQTALPRAGTPWFIRVAFDDDYVYVAVNCPDHQLGVDRLRNASGSRGRDQDLTDVDRIRFRIDTDRDLLTTMQLQVSEGGRTHDAIDGNPLWQPSWYVATHRADSFVVIEAAISRRDLVDLPITSGESWFLAADIQPAGSAATADVIPNPSDWLRVVFR